MDVTQVALGRFHHFHLARQLEARGRLGGIWTGYPRFKLGDEQGIPPEKIHAFPWFYVPAQLMPRLPLIGRVDAAVRAAHWAAVEALDRRVAWAMHTPTVLVGLSSGGRASGRRAQSLGGRHVCDRGSTHIRFQDAILRDEYRRWGQSFPGVDPRVIAKEEAEYAGADLITVPSDFCHRSFVEQGVAADKVRVIPYGGRLDRFKPVGEPDPQAFTVLFVGSVSIRKGLPYLLQAFARLRHPNKRLKIVGAIADDLRPLLPSLPTQGVDFLGAVPNTELAGHYSRADVMVLPSLEEGLALVMAEAMACGCPVVASENTGARNLYEDGVEGRIVEIRSTHAILQALEALADDRPGTRELGLRARKRIQSLGGYDRYGDQWAALLDELEGGPGGARSNG